MCKPTSSKRAQIALDVAGCTPVKQPSASFSKQKSTPIPACVSKYVQSRRFSLKKTNRYKKRSRIRHCTISGNGINVVAVF
ncbi:expressed protein [Echinococcus multilocularis]|uniref:Expressed protein n=1 Tax=Echinococcus multilocularis TaxID=6211 RepID=A0A068YBT1_ECHMU|nr:expressed protein [Echinococcus multilocularis]